MLGQTQNALLQKTEQEIEAKVPQPMQDAFQRTITAGLTVMYSPQSHGIMQQQLSKDGDPLQNVGEGAAKLVGLLYRQSNHKMPVSIAAPAAIVFMCEGLDFLEKSGKIQVTPDAISQASEETGQAVLQLFGISQDKLHQIVGKHLDGTQPDQPQPAPQSGGIIGSAMGAQS